ncbi:MAG: formate dehydrogenase accessory protein FdhE, partial [Paraburkholderia sp.]|nr:formate dehydrogenase accessory protein FdhE [Paraburkholderia sp.]
MKPFWSRTVVTQRILDPRQIETLDPSAIPRIRLPERSVF